MYSKPFYEGYTQIGDKQQTSFRLYPYTKRAFEIIFSITLLILTLPVMLLAALLIKLESRGPVFYQQERTGYEGSEFYIIKLRSMYVDAEKNGPQWAAANDPRVTRVGRWIRLTRIDELPQLINVLKGEMSLIGPRPERPVFTEKFAREIPGFKKRLNVKPGITGWAQVNGGYNVTPAQKFTMDMYYIEKQSFRLDLQILLRTVWVVLSGSGAR